MTRDDLVLIKSKIKDLKKSRKNLQSKRSYARTRINSFFDEKQILTKRLVEAKRESSDAYETAKKLRWCDQVTNELYSEKRKLVEEIEAKIASLDCKSGAKELEARVLDREIVAIDETLAEYDLEFDNCLIQLFSGGQGIIKSERRDKSGLMDIYYGGTHPRGDGICHGHAIIDENGHIVQLRRPDQIHGDYEINELKDDRGESARLRHRHRPKVTELLPSSI